MSHHPPKALLEASAFPHILDLILDFSSYEALLAFRATSRHLRDKADSRLFRHVVLVTKHAKWASPTRHNVAFALPDNPSRLLPCIPIHKPSSHPSGEADAINEIQVAASNHILSRVRVLDLATSPMARLPSFPTLAPEVVRLREENRRWSAHAAPILVEKVSINSVPQLDAFELPRIRRMGRTHTYIVFLRDHNPFGFPSRLARLPRTWEPRSLASLRNITLILPCVQDPSPTSMPLVVQAVRLCIKRFFSVIPKSVQITLVGVERFGPAFFGVDGDEDVQEAVRATFAEGEEALKPAKYARFRCTSWENWRDSQNYYELKCPPPFVRPLQ